MDIRNICGYDIDFDKLPNNFKYLSSERKYELDDICEVLGVVLRIEVKNGIDEVIEVDDLETALLLAKYIYSIDDNCKLSICENSYHCELECNSSRIFDLNRERILKMSFETKDVKLLKSILRNYPYSVIQDIKKEITNGHLLFLS